MSEKKWAKLIFMVMLIIVAFWFCTEYQVNKISHHEDAWQTQRGMIK